MGINVGIADRDVVGELLGIAVVNGEIPLVGIANGVGVGAFLVLYFLSGFAVLLNAVRC